MIKQIAQANPLWGALRIHGELLKLRIDVSERTVSRLIPKNRKPPSQTWRTFLDNHIREIVSIDFLVVPMRRILRSCFAYYYRSRTHLSLCKDALEPRAKQSPECGSVVEIAEVGGLHHRYERRAA